MGVLRGLSFAGSIGRFGILRGQHIHVQGFGTLIADQILPDQSDYDSSPNNQDSSAKWLNARIIADEIHIAGEVRSAKLFTETLSIGLASGTIDIQFGSFAHLQLPDLPRKLSVSIDEIRSGSRIYINHLPDTDTSDTECSLKINKHIGDGAYITGKHTAIDIAPDVKFGTRVTIKADRITFEKLPPQSDLKKLTLTGEVFVGTRRYSGLEG